MTGNIDEQAVRSFLGARGLRCESFSKRERSGRKTPDFRVFQEDTFRFFCEVKGIDRDNWIYRQLAEQPPGVVKIAGGSRPDPVYNRLAADIYAAVKQFDAVNPDLEHPNVLALVNHDHLCDVGDLHSVVTGRFLAEGGTAPPIFLAYSEGRIREPKRRVHLFIWLRESGSYQLWFTETHGMHHRNLCAWFGVDPETIPKLGS